MATDLFEPVGARRRATGAGRVARRLPPSPRPRLARAAAWVVVLGLLTVLSLGLYTEASADLNVPGGVALLLGGMTGLVGMYLALVQLLLISRIPPIERVLGQDGLLRWHRRVGPWPISLLAVHAVLTTIAFAQAAQAGPLHEIGVLLRSYPDMLAATVGLGLMLAAGIASFRWIRSRLKRETWWVLHLYMYLALALAFAHVLALGPSFVGHPVNQALWALVWAATAGSVLSYRFVLPLVRSLRHSLRVAEVHEEAPGVATVIMTGRHLERLPVIGGQFIAWRFLARGLWWQAHPYTLSALPRPPYLRITVRDRGDHSAALARLRPGTRVFIEGPYGALTPEARIREKVALIAGGIGVTAVRSLLEDLPASAAPEVIVRVPSRKQFALREEIATLVERRGGSLHELVGPRSATGSPQRYLRRLVPDLRSRDVYVCGPEGFVEEMVQAVHGLGVEREAVHREIYSW